MAKRPPFDTTLGAPELRDAPPLRTGEVVGNYRLGEKIGEGGMGDVYVGVHARIERRAAVKLLRSGWSPASDDGVTRFFTEARATA